MGIQARYCGRKREDCKRAKGLQRRIRSQKYGWSRARTYGQAGAKNCREAASYIGTRNECPDEDGYDLRNRKRAFMNRDGFSGILFTRHGGFELDSVGKRAVSLGRVGRTNEETIL